MKWIDGLPLWLVIISLVLLGLCILFCCLYIAEKRERQRLSMFINCYQVQVMEWRKIADDALDMGKRECQRAVSVLDRVLTEREKEMFHGGQDRL